MVCFGCSIAVALGQIASVSLASNAAALFFPISSEKQTSADYKFFRKREPATK